MTENFPGQAEADALRSGLAASGGAFANYLPDNMDDTLALHRGTDGTYALMLGLRNTIGIMGIKQGQLETILTGLEHNPVGFKQAIKEYQFDTQGFMDALNPNKAIPSSTGTVASITPPRTTLASTSEDAPWHSGFRVAQPTETVPASSATAPTPNRPIVVIDVSSSEPAAAIPVALHVDPPAIPAAKPVAAPTLPSPSSPITCVSAAVPPIPSVPAFAPIPIVLAPTLPPTAEAPAVAAPHPNIEQPDAFRMVSPATWSSDVQAVTTPYPNVQHPDPVRVTALTDTHPAGTAASDKSIVTFAEGSSTADKAVATATDRIADRIVKEIKAGHTVDLVFTGDANSDAYRGMTKAASDERNAQLANRRADTERNALLAKLKSKGVDVGDKGPVHVTMAAAQINQKVAGVTVDISTKPANALPALSVPMV